MYKLIQQKKYFHKTHFFCNFVSIIIIDLFVESLIIKVFLFQNDFSTLKALGAVHCKWNWQISVDI